MKFFELHHLIEAEAPIIGINSSGVIWFKPEATEDQKAAAQAVMDAELPNLVAE